MTEHIVTPIDPKTPLAGAALSDRLANIHQRILAAIRSVAYVRQGDKMMNGKCHFRSHDAGANAIPNFDPPMLGGAG